MVAGLEAVTVAEIEVEVIRTRATIQFLCRHLQIRITIPKIHHAAITKITEVIAEAEDADIVMAHEVAVDKISTKTNNNLTQMTIIGQVKILELVIQ